MLGIFFNVRLGSKRLHEKHLYKAKGKKIIEWQILRFKSFYSSKNIDVKFVICSSDKEENYKLIDIGKNIDVEVFFGSDTNIPLRHFQCASKFSVDFIISIDGDDIFTSPLISFLIYEKLQQGYPQCCSKGLPLGMNILVSYTKQELEKILNSLENESQLETGWGVKVMTSPYILNVDYPKYDNVRFTVDYLEDAIFVSKLIESLDEKILVATDDEIIDLTLKEKLYEINSVRW